MKPVFHPKWISRNAPTVSYRGFCVFKGGRKGGRVSGFSTDRERGPHNESGIHNISQFSNIFNMLSRNFTFAFMIHVTNLGHSRLVTDITRKSEFRMNI
jgi:hypothetical protein